MLTALIVILILISLIVVHELGHFIAAKIFGVRVDEFGIGYPPRALRFGKIGETEYTLNWIPFGGFVRLFGEDEGGAHGRGAFIDAPRWKQAVILISGVAMNALAAWLLFAAAFSVGILHPVDAPQSGARLIASDVLVGSPADAAGIRVGDQIIEVRDASAEAQLTPASIVEFISARPGKPVDITYLHAQATTTSTLIPAQAVVRDESVRPAIGLGLVLITNESLPWSQSLAAAAEQWKVLIVVIVQGLGELAYDAVHGHPNLQDVVGPVGLVSAVGDASSAGIGYVLSLAGFISLNLVVINLIPIPALDGGRLLIVAIEAIRRREAPKLLVQILNTLGIALIIVLMVTVTYHDVVRLFT